MVTTDVEFELRQQLKEAGKQLSNPPTSFDELLYILDQTEKLLSMVDQSPDNLMQEALKPPMKALVDDNFLKHLHIDVKASVAICICEITRITAPEAPYTDEEMKSVFQLIVSSFEYLYDESSRSYGKRVGILETVCKVRSCVIMLDLECDELIVKMFEHFLKSVRDHHLDKVFSLMSDIMVLVIEESEEISVDLLKTLLASIKINDEGVLPVARKLAEEVIKKSADKVGPYVKETLKFLSDSLDNYSQVLTAACEGSTDVVDHHDESVLVHKKADEIKLVPSSDDAVQVMSNGKMVTEKSDEAIDHIDISVAEKSTETETKPESVSSAEKITDNSVTDKKEIEKEPVIAACDKKEQTGVESEPKSKTLVIKGIGSKKTSGQSQSQSQTPSTVVVLTKASEVTSDSEMKSPKRARKMTLKAEENKASVTSGSDAEPKKASELVSDSEIKSPKHGRKRTQKTVSGSDAEPVKKSSKKTVGTDSVATGGSDTELLKKSTKKVETVDSESKPVKRSGKKKAGGGAYSVAAGGSDAELVQKSTKKGETVDSESKLVKSVVSVGAKYSVVKKGNKLSGKKEKETDSVDDKPLNNQSEKDDEETDSDNIPLKLSAKKGKKNGSSVVKVKSSAKTIPKKNLGSAKKVEEKEQPKSESDDDGMDVPINSVLKKRKLSVGKPKVKESIKYDNSLVGKKVKVWWPKDKMYYEGVIESFDAAKKKHKVLYLDGEDENLNLRTQKWEIITEYSAPVKEPKTSASKKPKNSTKKSKKSESNDDNKGEEKAVNLKEVEKSTEDEEAKNSVEPKKIVYKSKGKNKTPKTEQKADVSEPKSACETTVDEEMKDADVAAEEEPESVKEKSTESPKIGET